MEPVASSQQFPRQRRPEPVLITEAEPSLAEQHAARKKRYAITMGIRIVFIVLAAAFYQIVWLMLIFAILGTVLSMLQLLVYSVLARRGQRSVYFVWAAFVTLVLLGLTADSLRGLLSVVISVDSVLLAALLAISLYVIRPVRAEERV